MAHGAGRAEQASVARAAQPRQRPRVVIVNHAHELTARVRQALGWSDPRQKAAASLARDPGSRRRELEAERGRDFGADRAIQRGARQRLQRTAEQDVAEVTV
jgi:hypothetical protein